MGHVMQTTEVVKTLRHHQKLLDSLLVRDRHPLGSFNCLGLAKEILSLEGSRDDEPLVVVKPNSYWGEWEHNFLLQTDISIPLHWEQNFPIMLFLPLGDAEDFSHPEALVYVDGQPLAACDRHHQEILLPKEVSDGKIHELMLQGWTGRQRWDGSDPGKKPFIGEPALLLVDPQTRDLRAILRVASGVLSKINPNSNNYAEILNAISQALTLVDLSEPLNKKFYDSVEKAINSFQETLSKIWHPQRKNICAVGQSHIDLAWLWTLNQTRLKAGRTFHTVIHLMREFPEFIYTQSQPQLYEYVQQDYPDLFESIKQEVLTGRWEITGGMWVEADCNLSGAEALVRQLLLGRTYFEKQIGADAESPILWMPDTFGFPWSLPQLIAQSGLKYFLTIKMGWNDTNKLPYDSFWWQGLDGTRILTHFGSNECNVFLSPENVIAALERYQQKEDHDEFAILYGWGDGGGGPTREMLENRRLLEQYPSLPQVKPDRMINFFERLENQSGADLPDWQDELYLERHRGVFTTHGDIKQANRKCEFLLHNLEFLAVVAVLLDPDYVYPQKDLEEAWKCLCLNQFHDILPGTSIREVYVEAHEHYDHISSILETNKEKALFNIGNKLGGDFLITNPNGFYRSEISFWPGYLPERNVLVNHDGLPIATQEIAEGTLINSSNLPPYSINSFRLTNEPVYQKVGFLSVSENVLENDYLYLQINNLGEITGLYDKIENRELIPSGEQANKFMAYVDRPVESDAWDLDINYVNKPVDLGFDAEIKVLEKGPLRATLQLKRKLLNSCLVQNISLDHNSSRVDFRTYINWQERHILLRVAFPVNIHSYDATFEIQWGNITRPTHRNTSWDEARFEVCAHKWVDLSEEGYGVSLLNDCKYGHRVLNNVLSLSLLRGTTSPDAEADLGENNFVYSLLPHAGGWRNFTIPEAYGVNNPLIVYKQESSNFSGKYSLVSSGSSNIVIETVKRAENGNGIIFRLFEAHNRRSPVSIRTAFDLEAVWRIDLLENNLEKLEFSKNQIFYEIKPFEILSLRVIPIS